MTATPKAYFPEAVLKVVQSVSPRKLKLLLGLYGGQPVARKDEAFESRMEQGCSVIKALEWIPISDITSNFGFCCLLDASRILFNDHQNVIQQVREFRENEWKCTLGIS